MSASHADERVTPKDIESKLRQIRGQFEETTESARSGLVAAGVVGAVVLVTVAYVLGRRRGRRRSTVVEIRRV
ncbi:MAG TPA: hypothetical protein VH112_02055 [Acidimicrobiales bacterium]|jgi:hypothetical protein|nr:hypothetical protein [Acidimicrobiales bacterium]